MDEPLTALDAPLRNQLRRELREWHRSSGATVLYVTHDQTEALMLGDRVAVMKEGELQQVGSPAEIYERPVNCFVAGFLGSPPMNLVEGEISDREGLTFRSGDWALPLPAVGDGAASPRPSVGCRVVLGIRPEHLAPLCAGEAKDEGGLSTQAVVQFTEQAGDVRVVYVKAGAPSDKGDHEARSQADATESWRDGLAVKWSAAPLPQPGEVVPIGINARRIHFFDAASGRNLALPESG
jgi:multiple sugar transport system ATP-binding protein